MNYKGTIIEESLDNTDVLKHMKIFRTDVEPIKDAHQTPWLKHWTLHRVEIKNEDAGSIAEALSNSLEKEHSWYADYKNDQLHYIIFRGKVFKIIRDSTEQYFEAKSYALSLGIPEHQCDFSPEIK